ncbi:hypothetical protein DERP_006264 [Dermatophagoides pteronyssinus]|uniref:Uncharacterized protein n=1 Tax=Dermatophagoides pteronyssinus TaxID=6956 RepID=A0ABQ8IXX5_DERPT|nr:hypothetical protein DERP_006264 [Dermatophagoides pteronyssinus]
MKFNQIHKSNHQKLDYKSKTLEIIVGYNKKNISNSPSHPPLSSSSSSFQSHSFFSPIQCNSEKQQQQQPDNSIRIEDGIGQHIVSHWTHRIAFYIRQIDS